MFKFYLINVIHILFSCYTFIIFGRILLSWVPSLQNYTFVRFISFLTDPYLNVFRRIIPPLGGVLDISPILAFFALRIGESILIRFLL